MWIEGPDVRGVLKKIEEQWGGMRNRGEGDTFVFCQVLRSLGNRRSRPAQVRLPASPASVLRRASALDVKKYGKSHCKRFRIRTLLSPLRHLFRLDSAPSSAIFG